jgi:hypothetical protein
MLFNDLKFIKGPQISGLIQYKNKTIELYGEDELNIINNEFYEKSIKKLSSKNVELIIDRSTILPVLLDNQEKSRPIKGSTYIYKNLNKDKNHYIMVDSNKHNNFLSCMEEYDYIKKIEKISGSNQDYQIIKDIVWKLQDKIDNYNIFSKKDLEGNDKLVYFFNEIIYICRRQLGNLWRMILQNRPFEMIQYYNTNCLCIMKQILSDCLHNLISAANIYSSIYIFGIIKNWYEKNESGHLLVFLKTNQIIYLINFLIKYGLEIKVLTSDGTTRLRNDEKFYKEYINYLNVKFKDTIEIENKVIEILEYKPEVEIESMEISYLREELEMELENLRI